MLTIFIDYLRNPKDEKEIKRNIIEINAFDCLSICIQIRIRKTQVQVL